MRIEPFAPTNTENNIPAANSRNSSGNSSVHTNEHSSREKLSAVQTDKAKTQTNAKNRQLPVPQFPEDEVTVQFDKPMNDGILIYQFLDKQSGNLILQVPSSQVLGVMHEIQSKLQEQATEDRGATQSAEETAITRGTTHGD